MSQELSSLATEIKSSIVAMRENNEKIGSRFDKLQIQVDAIDATTKSRPSGQPLDRGGAFRKQLAEDEGIARLLKDKRGRAILHLGADAIRELQTKTILTETVTGSVGSDTAVSAGLATTGVLPLGRLAGITMEARQTLKVRDLLATNPTQFAAVDFLKVSTPMAPASPVAEGSLKPEQNLNFSSSSERVKTVASFATASRQILDDLTELGSFVFQALTYYNGLAVEQQLLSGDGTGENLHGLIVQAAAFNTALLPSAAKGWNKIDIIGSAIGQLAIAKELKPTFVVLNEKDWLDIRLTKDGFGRYLLGDPGAIVAPSLFGLDVVSTTTIALGTFLVGSGSALASEIRTRMEMVVEVSTEHLDYFQRNLVAVRGEERLAFLVKRANSYITGTFSTSP